MLFLRRDRWASCLAGLLTIFLVAAGDKFRACGNPGNRGSTEFDESSTFHF